MALRPAHDARGSSAKTGSLVRGAGGVALASLLAIAATAWALTLAVIGSGMRTRTSVGIALAVLIEVVILAIVIVVFRQRIAVQADMLDTHRRDLTSRADDLEAQAIQLEEQTVQLEQQADEARTLAGRLEINNEELQRALTEAGEARATVAAERQFLRQVIDVNPNFVFAKDRDGRFTLVNRAVADVYGTSIEALVGKTDADFNRSKEEVEAFRRDDLEVMDTLATRHISEERITDASGGVRWLQTVKRPIVGPTGHAEQVLGVSTDITERKRLEAQLVQSQKIEAVGRLAGGIAHDFNNLLTVITSYTGMVLEQLGSDDALRDDVLEVKKAADRAARLTSQLLAFSRKQIAQPRVLDINLVVRDLDKMLGRLISEDIDLRIVSGPQQVYVRADRGQLEQIIVNLAVNARDAMPSGGHLLIETATAEIGPEAGRRMFPPPPGEYAVMTVSDTGTGMDPETMSHIFEPFFTTKPPDKGTGLGLSTVYGIVKQLGGDVRIQSETGRGTRVRIYLPRLTAAEPDLPGAVTQPATESGGHGTILLVEDDPALRVLAERVLAAVGYTVLAAPNGPEALAICRGHAGAIDLIATDVVMPGMSGRALVEQVSAQRPGVKVLYMSGYTDDDIVRRGMGASPSVFLQKPFTPDVLSQYVREAMGRSA